MLANNERDGVHVVESRERARLFDGIGHRSHVAQPNRLRADRGDDEVVEIPDVAHPAQRAHDQFARALVHAARGHFEILLQQRRTDILDRQAAGAELVDIDGHLHGACAAADHDHRADVRHRFQDLLDLPVHDVGDLLQIARRADTERHDRHGVEIEFVDDRRVGALRQLRQNRVHLVAHVLGSDVAVAFEEELDGDARDTFDGRAAQLVNALDGVDDFLQRLGHARFHFFRRRAAQRGGDGDDGQFDVRELVHADAPERKPAEHDEEQIDHRRKNRPRDAKVGDAEAARGLRRHLGSRRVSWRLRAHRAGVSEMTNDE